MINYIKLFILSVVIILSVTGCSSQKELNINQNFLSNLSEEEIADFYSKDGNFIRYNGIIMPWADIETFEPINEIYSKDKDYIFCGTDILLDDSRESINPDSFKLLNNEYVQDGNSILHVMPLFPSGGCNYKTVKIENTDLSTLENEWSHFYDEISLNTENFNNEDCGNNKTKIPNSKGCNFLKDKNFVYYRDSIVESADPATFEILTNESETGPIQYGYAKDKNSTFFFFWDLGGRDVLRINESDPYTFTVIIGSYAKDKNNVYYQDSILEGADPETFEVLKGFWAKDKNYVYTSTAFRALSNYNKILEGADPVTFEVINSKYSKDKNFVYFKNEKIDKDPSSVF